RGAAAFAIASFGGAHARQPPPRDAIAQSGDLPFRAIAHPALRRDAALRRAADHGRSIRPGGILRHGRLGDFRRARLKAPGAALAARRERAPPARELWSVSGARTLAFNHA